MIKLTVLPGDTPDKVAGAEEGVEVGTQIGSGARYQLVQDVHSQIKYAASAAADWDLLKSGLKHGPSKEAMAPLPTLGELASLLEKED